jgi:UDP-N-acetylmuramoylalanine--D-glutamate ligase
MRALQQLSVLVLGLGDSGLAMVRWCVRHGADVLVVDTREQPPHLAQLTEEHPSVVFKHAPFDASLVEGQPIRAVFKSPGLTPQSVAPVWKAAQAAGLWVGTELTLFAQALEEFKTEQQYAPHVLAITGTNGKTTVTALTGQLLERAGLRVAVAGNIGPTLLDTLSAAMDQEQAQWPQAWVLELSSFQLDQVDTFEPTAATALNLTQDHLDWHGDMQAYAQAKAHIFGQQACMVLNRDDTQVMAILPAPVVKTKGSKQAPREVMRFGVDMPKQHGDWGLETVNGMTWLVRALDMDDTKKSRATTESEIYIQRLLPVDALRIRGRHNALNAMAALALASTTGAPLAAMLYALREYRGEPHRVSTVAVLQDVEYIDDSKGTNVGATVAAINSVGADRRIVLVLGGDGKGQNFTPLQAPIQKYVRSIVLIGKDAVELRLALQGAGVPMHDAPSLEDAVKVCQSLAQMGDAVLLSPACASFDMFKNYVHRGEVFAQAVQELALDLGLELDFHGGVQV